jgi:hypothetical protein
MATTSGRNLFKSEQKNLSQVNCAIMAEANRKAKESVGMNESFAKKSKYFFWVAGILTALGSVPTMLSPVGGLRLSFGLSYFDQSPQIFPIVGNWGIMGVGIGVLFFLSFRYRVG